MASSKSRRLVKPSVRTPARKRTTVRPRRPARPTPSQGPQGPADEVIELCTIPDALAGFSLKTYLQQAGIPAELKDMSSSFYATVLTAVQGYWGKVLVPRSLEPRARRLVDAFWRAHRRAH